MAGFILVHTKLFVSAGSEDDLIQELTQEVLGYFETSVNIKEIIYTIYDGKDTIIKLSNEQELKVKESTNEVHQAIKRASALYLPQ
jgi:uncharacterized protein YlzI (FlbEa/FlbD family)